MYPHQDDLSGSHHAIPTIRPADRSGSAALETWDAFNVELAEP